MGIADIFKRLTGPVTVGLLVTLLVAALQFGGWAVLDRVGLLLFDAWQRAAPREYTPAPVRVVDIDEESIDRLGQWPWPRTDLARLNRVLGEAGASVVAYDIVFSEPDRTSPAQVAEGLGDEGLAARFDGLPDHDAAFAESMAALPVVNGFFVLGEDRGRSIEPKAPLARRGNLPTGELIDFPGAVQALPVLQDAAQGTGSLSLQGDDDEMVRRAPLLFLQDGQLLPSLSLEALRLYGGGNAPAVRTAGGSDGAGAVVQMLRAGGRTVPTDGAGEMWIHYTPETEAREVPAWQVISGALSPEQLREKFEGHIVFVGPSAEGLRDIVATPLNPRQSGVLVHAQAAEQMLLGHFLERPDTMPGIEFALVILLGGGLALLLPRLGATWGAVLGTVGIIGVIAASWLAFSQALHLFNPTYPALAIVLVYTFQTVLRYYREERQRAYIHDAFDRYLSPEMVRQISENPDALELGGEERDMTVLMCDIRGFSRISEQFSPSEVIDFLIGFLTPMSEILLAHKATLDKYIGDAILAFWNAPLDDPDHHRNGARAALAMVDALDELNETMPGKQGQTWPDDVSIGIGLNSGVCCVGNMGSRQRLSYTLIGDTVNLAARLEGQTKAYGVKIIVGSALAENLDGFAMIELDRLRVVGRDKPETIFALLGDEKVARSDAFRQQLQAHSKVLTAYRVMDWDEAETLLGRHEAGYAEADLSKLVTIYRERIDQLRADPPGAGWDGVYQATSK